MPFIFLYHLGVSYYIPPIVALKLLLLSFVKDETHEVAALVDPHQEMYSIGMYQLEQTTKLSLQLVVWNSLS